MSWFGHGTVKQRILDEVENVRKTKDLSDSDMVSILLDIMRYYIEEIDNEEL